MPKPYLVLMSSVMSVSALRSEMVCCAIASTLFCSHERAVEVTSVREAPEIQYVLGPRVLRLSSRGCTVHSGDGPDLCHAREDRPISDTGRTVGPNPCG